MTRAINERRPAAPTADLRGSRAASKRNQAERTTRATVAGSTDSPIPPRLDWAAGLIDRATGPVPQYGSPEWEALDDHDPVKVAATVIAAESWRTWWLPEEIAHRLRTELEVATDFELTQAQRESYARGGPSFAELCERRGEPERASRAREQRRRLGLSVEEREDAPTQHADGRPVRYRAPLRVVPNG